ncbi:hypothetical protein KIW84_012476 [Lathyrus oleraceus]|uniref:Retrotransposon gag domain-containing protein n=1 Tax=Pisum sativum TaxID=3888 RepID=A0A9D5GWT1_PEA|nr:hypothetical protein KIW84_012476 [Pisum sativum]
MANNNIRWPSPSQAYTGSNHDKQPQPESDVGRRNRNGCRNDVREEPSVVINNDSNDDNNGNMSDIVFGDSYSNIGGKPYMFLPSAKDVWEVVKETYSDIQNSFQIFGLKSKLWHTKQCDRSVTAYYNMLLTLRKELYLYYNDNWMCTKDNVLFLKRQENDRVFMFLVGLNKDLDEVRGSTLATRNLNEGRRLDKVPWCDHCKHEWHTPETCWKLKGKPPNWKKKSCCAFQASNSDQGKQPPPS